MTASAARKAGADSCSGSAGRTVYTKARSARHHSSFGSMSVPVPDTVVGWLRSNPGPSHGPNVPGPSLKVNPNSGRLTSVSKMGPKSSNDVGATSSTSADPA